MTKFASIQISADRLTLWRRRNEREKLVTTPMLLVSAIHDAPPSAPTVACNITEDIPLEDVRLLLLAAIKQIDETIKRGN